MGVPVITVDKFHFYMIIHQRVGPENAVDPPPDQQILVERAQCSTASILTRPQDLEAPQDLLLQITLDSPVTLSLCQSLSTLGPTRPQSSA